MARKNVTFGISEEVYERLQMLFPDGSIGTAANMETMINCMESAQNFIVSETEDYKSLEGSCTRLQQDYSEIQENYRRLQEDYTALQANCNDCTGVSEKLQDDYKELQDDYKRLQEDYAEMRNDYNGAIRDLQALQINDSSDDVKINMPENIRALLMETTKRLSEKYNKEISYSEVLVKMFLRYTVEQYTLWFYPFVLSNKDIADITGITVGDWMTFINNK